MPLALAALRELLRRTQQHLGDALSPALTRAVDRLGSINALDASNQQEIEVGAASCLLVAVPKAVPCRL